MPREALSVAHEVFSVAHEVFSVAHEVFWPLAIGHWVELANRTMIYMRNI